MKKIDELIKKNPKNFLLSLLAIILIALIIGIVFFPSLFYDNWIWKYYWGPVVADASDGVATYNGVKAYEGYTIVSEITYGFILICALYAIYLFLKKLEIKIDWRFALALMPYILFGPTTRVLEDTGFFDKPWEYWFISPLIYLQIAIYALFFVFLGYYLQKKYENKYLTVNSVVFSGGMIFLLPSILLILNWIIGNNWSETTGVRFDVFLIVTFLISLIVFLVYLIGYFYKENKNFTVYKNPLNLTLLFGHMMDGITSYISIKDPFNMGLNYAEKHPASNFLLEVWGPLFPIVKFLLIIIVIYVFDILYKDELKDHINLVNLLKIGILILGFSPGLRDLLRVTMGV